MSSKAPLCRPWHHGNLIKRLSTFKFMTWFAKPGIRFSILFYQNENIHFQNAFIRLCGAGISTILSWPFRWGIFPYVMLWIDFEGVSALNCARRGWINVDMDIIACEACEARLLFSTPPSWSQQQGMLFEKAALVFSLKLDSGHKLLCPWMDNNCDEKLAQFPPTEHPILVDKFRDRCSALLQLSALPLISSSAIEYMKNPHLEQFLEQSLTQEHGNGFTNISRPEYLINECDADSLMLYFQALWSYCRIMGFLYCTVSYGCTELHTENHSVIRDSGTENGRDIVNGGLEGATLSKERLSNLNLTIAGVHPPTKQNFKATISLPVIGQNLRARFSNDSKFRDRIFFDKAKGYTREKGDAHCKESDSNKSMEGTEINGLAIQPDDGMHDFLVGSNVEFKASAEDPANSHITKSSLTTPGDSATNIIGENDRNDLSLIVPSSSGNALHISGSNVVDAEDTPLTSLQESCSEANVDVGESSTDTETTLVAQAISQEGNGGRFHTPVNNELVVFSTGNNDITHLLAFQ
ncbi:hypothetical protein FNV43_RR20068 [Rhamnella rubrinervis]|uniref:C3HC-type domain-containing protein n=1 Tax=Rhamnella rubrinervis TaxID=2594499 RepID=A0A8K0DU59_9ROSA|nr:hypothetical protein FNV43_RR20068 [Rhamnella rubrinervis]